MKRHLVYGIGFIIFLILLVLHRELSFIVALFILIIANIFVDREKLWAWIPVLIISGIWMLIAHRIYDGYESFKFMIFGIALFPIVTWPLGLMTLYLLMAPLVKINIWYKKWIVLFILYAIILITVETIGYNVLGIRLDYGKINNYPGWPILNCFHSPAWMQIGYFLNGLLFFGATSFIEHKRSNSSN